MLRKFAFGLTSLLRWPHVCRHPRRRAWAGSCGNPSASLDEAIAHFHKDPFACFQGTQCSPYKWDLIDNPLPNIKALNNIKVVSLGYTLGHVEGISVNLKTGAATIGHFATAYEVTGRGIGRRLAFALRDELQIEHGITEIVFRECSTRYQEAHYPYFFASLGAVVASSLELDDKKKDIWIWSL